MEKISQRTGDDCLICVLAMVMGPPYTYERVLQDSKNAVAQTNRARAQRDGFRGKIEQLIATHGCTYIGEETNPGQLTSARHLAQGLAYHNIDMPPAQRSAQGIPPGYDESSNYTPAQKQAWNQLREQYMLGQVQATRGAHQSLLIICGVRHMIPLRDLFVQSHETPITVDVTQADWFSGPLNTDWLSE